MDQLRDIHPPAPIGWWPPAPGWWVLAALTLLTTIWLVHMAVQRYQRALYRREATALMGNIWKSYATSHDSGLLTRELLTAARRCAVSSSYGSTSHTLPTETLLTAVNGCSDGQLLRIIPMAVLTGVLYNPEAEPLSDEQAQALHDCALRWVSKGAPLPC